VLAGVDKGDRHRSGVAKKRSTPQGLGRRPEEQRDEQGAARVQRWHRGHWIASFLTDLDQATDGVEMEVVPAQRGDAADGADLAQIGGEPWWGGRVHEVAAHSDRREGED
jgi:hypothetical protein